MKKSITNDSLPFTLFELRRASIYSWQTAPGKDGICYNMLAHMDNSTLFVKLKLFNKVLESGKIPVAWKQSIIVPILKPGKYPSDPSSDPSAKDQ